MIESLKNIDPPTMTKLKQSWTIICNNTWTYGTKKKKKKTERYTSKYCKEIFISKSDPSIIVQVRTGLDITSNMKSKEKVQS